MQSRPGKATNDRNLREVEDDGPDDWYVGLDEWRGSGGKGAGANGVYPRRDKRIIDTGCAGEL